LGKFAKLQRVKELKQKYPDSGIEKEKIRIKDHLVHLDAENWCYQP